MFESNITFLCPCCGESLKFKLVKSEFGEVLFKLFHNTPEILYKEIQAQDYEFGAKNGGEIINGENADIFVQQDN